MVLIFLFQAVVRSFSFKRAPTEDPPSSHSDIESSTGTNPVSFIRVHMLMSWGRLGPYICPLCMARVPQVPTNTCLECVLGRAAPKKVLH